jgi:hypothetical protein
MTSSGSKRAQGVRTIEGPPGPAIAAAGWPGDENSHVWLGEVDGAWRATSSVHDRMSLGELVAHGLVRRAGASYALTDTARRPVGSAAGRQVDSVIGPPAATPPCYRRLKMTSVVASTFRDTLAADLVDERSALLDPARGGGPEHREMNRALMLGDRAAREWAAAVLARARPGAKNRLEALDQLSRPEEAYHRLAPAVEEERKSAATDDERDLLDRLGCLAEHLQALDTEASNELNRASFEGVGQAAAEVLVAAGRAHGDDDPGRESDEGFALARANETLRDLVSLDGWTNRLGPRYG